MANNGWVALSKIRQIAIPVNDEAEAKIFYRDRLGMRHLFDAPPALSFFDCGGVQLMLCGPAAQGEDAEKQRAVIFYDVDDINDVHSKLRAAGVEIIHDPRVIARMSGREIWIAHFADGQGNTLGLMSDVAAA